MQPIIKTETQILAAGGKKIGETPLGNAVYELNGTKYFGGVEGEPESYIGYKTYHEAPQIKVLQPNIPFAGPFLGISTNPLENIKYFAGAELAGIGVAKGIKYVTEPIGVPIVKGEIRVLSEENEPMIRGGEPSIYGKETITAGKVTVPQVRWQTWLKIKPEEVTFFETSQGRARIITELEGHPSFVVQESENTLKIIKEDMKKGTSKLSIAVEETPSTSQTLMTEKTNAIAVQTRPDMRIQTTNMQLEKVSETLRTPTDFMEERYAGFITSTTRTTEGELAGKGIFGVKATTRTYIPPEKVPEPFSIEPSSNKNIFTLKDVMEASKEEPIVPTKTEINPPEETIKIAKEISKETSERLTSKFAKYYDRRYSWKYTNFPIILRPKNELTARNELSVFNQKTNVFNKQKQYPSTMQKYPQKQGSEWANFGNKFGNNPPPNQRQPARIITRTNVTTIQEQAQKQNQIANQPQKQGLNQSINQAANQASRMLQNTIVNQKQNTNQVQNIITTPKLTPGIASIVSLQETHARARKKPSRKRKRYKIKWKIFPKADEYSKLLQEEATGKPARNPKGKKVTAIFTQKILREGGQFFPTSRQIKKGRIDILNVKPLFTMKSIRRKRK
jgi:hypothetical protein